MYDLIIRNGRIIDGAGLPWFWGDVAVKDGKIAAVGTVDGAAKEEVDAHGMVIAPGFIDCHTHGDVALIDNPVNTIKLLQGVTTEIVGNCGLSPFPCSDAHEAEWRSYLEPILGARSEPYPWRSTQEYMDLLGKGKFAHNVGVLVGSGALRAAVSGYDPSPLTPERLEQTKALAKQALDAGCVGISMGLVYSPDNFYKDEELSAVMEVLRGTGKPMVVHMRGEGAQLADCVRQAVKIAKDAGVPLEISHLKAIDVRGWAQLDEALDVIAQARAEGQDVTADAYPYLAGATQLISCLGPDLMHDGVEGAMEILRDPEKRAKFKAGIHKDYPHWDNYLTTLSWDNVQIAYVKDPDCQKYCGKTITEAAAMMGMDPDEAALELILINEGCLFVFMFYMRYEDIHKIYDQPYTMVASDSIYVTGGLPHPRLYGTFPRILQMVREDEGMISLERAVQKMTSFPAQRFGLMDRGVLRVGMAADITVFDPDTAADVATYMEPRQTPRGIAHVFVAGEQVVRDGAYTGATPGKLIRK